MGFWVLLYMMVNCFFVFEIWYGEMFVVLVEVWYDEGGFDELVILW